MCHLKITCYRWNSAGYKYYCYWKIYNSPIKIEGRKTWYSSTCWCRFNFSSFTIVHKQLSSRLNFLSKIYATFPDNMLPFPEVTNQTAVPPANTLRRNIDQRLKTILGFVPFLLWLFFVRCRCSKAVTAVYGSTYCFVHSNVCCLLRLVLRFFLFLMCWIVERISNSLVSKHTWPIHCFEEGIRFILLSTWSYHQHDVHNIIE